MTSSPLDDLLGAIDALAGAVYTGDRGFVERRRREAHAFVRALVPPPPDPHACDDCGLAFTTPARLAEHRHNVHAGPVPEHWQRDDDPARC